MDQFQQLIYNKHLASYKKHQNKPFKFRIKFDDIDEVTKTSLLRLSFFFNQHKSIDIDAFFKAPYEIYPDAVKFDLKFYSSLKAIKIYKEYIKKIARQDINSDSIKAYYLQSIKFIVNFCKENKIPFLSYPDHKKGYVNSFFEHLKNGTISIYALFMFPTFDTAFKTVDQEMRNYIIGDIYPNVDKNRAKFYSANEKTKEYFKKVFDLCKNH